MSTHRLAQVVGGAESARRLRSEGRSSPREDAASARGEKESSSTSDVRAQPAVGSPRAARWPVLGLHHIAEAPSHTHATCKSRSANILGPDPMQAKIHSFTFKLDFSPDLLGS